MRLHRSCAIAVAVTALAGAARLGHGEPLAAIITNRAAVGLPDSLAITAIHLPPRLAGLDVEPTAVDIDFPLLARPGRASVRVRIGKRSVFVPVTIAAVADVAIAVRDLEAGRIVTADDVRWERRAADGAAAAAIGSLVSAPIGAGQVLDDARLTTPPAIARGTAVAVLVERGAIAITTRGHLEQSTRIGATARVRLQSGGYASGTLIDADRVRVEAP